MALLRQPVAYVQPSKHHHSVLSSPAGLSCGYSTFSDAPSITGYHGAGWSLDADAFSTSPQAPSVPMSQHRRWSSEDIATRARDRRSECRMSALEPLTTSAQVLPEHNTFSPSSSDLLRPPSFQSSYHRHSGDFTEWSGQHHQQQWDLNHDVLQNRFNNGPHGTTGGGATSSSSWSQLSSLSIPNFEPPTYDIFSSSASSSSSLYTPNDHQLNGYDNLVTFSPVPSPSPSPVYLDSLPLQHHHQPYPVSRPSRRGSDTKSDASNGGKSCSHCRATSTPLWRRDPSTMKPLCNACGLYLQQRNKLRPQELIDADDDGEDTSEESDANYVGPECSHCHTHHTSVWRRSKSGEQLCNACGVYARLRGKPRPLSLKKRKIRPRSKHGPK